MQVTVALKQLKAAYRLLRATSKDPANDAQLLAELRHLIASYEAEVCTFFPSNTQPRSISYWQEYFRLKPSSFGKEARARLRYAQDTKVSFSVSAELAKRLDKR
jgi:hypothetical protein